MFKRVNSNDTFKFTFDGNEITAAPGESIAAALLANGIVALRKTHTSSNQRGPFCMMGACYDCLVEVDGRTVQSCMIVATPAMQVNRAKARDEASQ